MKNNVCPKCGSREIMADVEALARKAMALCVHVVEPDSPSQSFFSMQGSAYGDLRAWICAACGYTEFYANNLAELYKYYRKGRP